MSEQAKHPERVWVLFDKYGTERGAFKGSMKHYVEAVEPEWKSVEYVRTDLSDSAPEEQQDAVIAALKSAENAVLAWLDWMALPGDTTALGHHEAMMTLKGDLATLLRFREPTP